MPRLPSIERLERQAAYRDAVAELAHADETDDDARKSAAVWRVAEAVEGLRAVGIEPVRGRG